MKQTLLLLFLLIASYAYSQQIEGVILDAKTNQPVPFATIYLNGTTYGTISDSIGHFSLNYKEFRGEVVFNHVSYESVVKNINQLKLDEILIYLQPKTVEISSVSVETKGLRQKNLDYFKSIFLGSDQWGNKASILNDSVLFFNIEYRDVVYEDDTTKVKSHFEVKADVPLQISLPALGYILEYDLVRFTENYDSVLNSNVIKNYGHFFFREVDIKSKRQKIRIHKKRLKAYYNSTMHFMRSVYQNQLNENGYLVYKRQEPNDTIKIRKLERVGLKPDSISTYNSNMDKTISGLRGSKFFIEYYEYGNKPVFVDKPNKNLYKVHYSKLFIIADTCELRKDGTMAGGEYVFKGDIIAKRIGAALPSNFNPDEN